MNSKLKPASSRFKATSTRSKRIPSASRSEEHTSELQSLTNLVCRLLLEKKEHTSELQSLTNLVCRLLLEKKKQSSNLMSVKYGERNSANLCSSTSSYDRSVQVSLQRHSLNVFSYL